MARQAVELRNHPLHASNERGKLRIAYEAREIDPHEAGLFELFAGSDRPMNGQLLLIVDAEQAMDIGTGAGATTAGLNAEAIAQYAGNKLVVHKTSISVPDPECGDQQVCGHRASQHLDARIGPPPGKRGTAHGLGPLVEPGLAHRRTHDCGKLGADIADHVGRAGFFACHWIVKIIMSARRYKADRAAAWRRGLDQHGRIAPHHQHALRRGTADKLVRREHQRIDMHVRRGLHQHRAVRRRPGIVSDHLAARRLHDA
jgi:hypothetical protein